MESSPVVRVRSVPRVRWLLLAVIGIAVAGSALRWWTSRFAIREFEYLGGTATAEGQPDWCPDWFWERWITDQNIDSIRYGTFSWNDLPVPSEDYVFSERHGQIAIRFKRLAQVIIDDAEIKAAAFKPFEGTSNVKTLWLTNCRFESGTLAPLAAMRGVEGVYLDRSTVEDDDIAALSSHDTLRHLSLLSTHVGDAGLVHLKGLTRLRDIALSGPAVTNAGMVNLAQLSELLWLTLRETAVTDGGLESLRNLPINSLNLCDTRITDVGLRHVAALTNLTVLDLSGTDVSDAGLQHLHRLARLGVINLNGTNVTDAGIDAFDESMPHTRVEYFRSHK